jgi:hypothetical protein
VKLKLEIEIDTETQSDAEFLQRLIELLEELQGNY